LVSSLLIWRFRLLLKKGMPIYMMRFTAGGNVWFDFQILETLDIISTTKRAKWLGGSASAR